MKRLLGMIVCRFRGHKRGKRLQLVSATGTAPMNTFACPRCGAQWTRKAKA